MSRISPETYSLRVTTLEIVRGLLVNQLFLTEKDALLFVCMKAKLNKVRMGFDVPYSALDFNNFPDFFEKVYERFKKFKAVFDNEESEVSEFIS